MRWLDHPVFLNGVGFLLFFTACVVAFGGAYYVDTFTKKQNDKGKGFLIIGGTTFFLLFLTVLFFAMGEAAPMRPGS